MSKFRESGKGSKGGPADAGTQSNADRGAAKQERAQRTYALIIEQAADAFGRAGYEGASLNEIIRGTGLTKGAFYHHFKSKEELALAVFHAKQSELAGRIREAAETEQDARAKLRKLLLRRAEVLASEPSLGCFLRLATDMVARFGPGSEFARSYEIPLGIFADLVAEGQRQGVFRRTIDPRVAGEAVLSAMLGADELSKASSGGADLLERTEKWLSVMLAGLAADPGEAKRTRRK